MQRSRLAASYATQPSHDTQPSPVTQPCHISGTTHATYQRRKERKGKEGVGDMICLGVDEEAQGGPQLPLALSHINLRTVLLSRHNNACAVCSKAVAFQHHFVGQPALLLLKPVHVVRGV